MDRIPGIHRLKLILVQLPPLILLQFFFLATPA
jgi:hypothetical protein